MAQITLYLDAATAAALRRTAKSAGLSMSRWASELIRREVADQWPDEILELAGAWPDMPSAEALRESLGDDLPRAKI